jgi:lysozyme
LPRKRKNYLFRTVARVVFVVTAIFIVAYYTIAFFNKPPHIKYPAFGIDIPPGYLIHGIDVSRYQHLINWQDVKEMQVNNIKLGFAFIKATEGINKVDDQFDRNWLNAEEAGITKGAYHFFIAGKSGKSQANNFIEIVKIKSGDLPPVLDVEQTYNVPREKMINELMVWLQIVETYYHVKPIIYTNIDFYNKYLKEGFEDYPIWIAHYLQPDKPRLDHQWVFWQRSEKGRVDGIKTPVDFDVFSGDSIDFRNLLVQ